MFKALLTIIILAFSTAQMWATAVPVFRFALENWEEHPHLILAPSSWDQAQREKLSNLYHESYTWLAIDSADEDYPPGIYFNEGFGPWHDLPSKPEDVEILRRQLAGETGPAIAQRIARGDSIVLLIFGGSQEEKKAAEDKIRPRLEQHLSTIKLREEVIASWKNFHQPPLYDNSPRRGRIHTPVPLGLAASFMYIEDNDPISKQLTVLSLDEDKGKTQVTAVIGRGRALPLGAADNIEIGLIDELVQFVTGACSCQIKDQNPGYDLFLGVNWYEVLMNASTELPGEIPGRIVGQFLDPKKLDDEGNYNIGEKFVDISVEQHATEQVVTAPKSALIMPVEQLDNTDVEQDDEEKKSEANTFAAFASILIAALVVLGFSIATTRGRRE